MFPHDVGSTYDIASKYEFASTYNVASTYPIANIYKVASTTLQVLTTLQIHTTLQVWEFFLDLLYTPILLKVIQCRINSQSLKDTKVGYILREKRLWMKIPWIFFCFFGKRLDFERNKNWEKIDFWKILIFGGLGEDFSLQVL